MQQQKKNLHEVPVSRQWYSQPLTGVKTLFPPAIPPEVSPSIIPKSEKKTGRGATRRTRKHKVTTTANRRRGGESPLEMEIQWAKANRKGKRETQESQWQQEGNPRRKAQSKSAEWGQEGKGKDEQGDGRGRRKKEGTKAKEKTQDTSKPVKTSPLAPGASVPLGERAQLMQPLHLAHTHGFYDTLREWESGVPVDCGADWSREAIDLAIQKGPHRSALDATTMQTVHEDVHYQVEAGFSSIVLWDNIKEALPKRLKISPLAVVPQKDRWGRLILDLSFAVHLPSTKRRRMGETIQKSVNDTTTQLAPQEPVREIGNVLKRMFDLMAEVPAEEDIMLSKIDLSDGFWRGRVTEENSWNVAYVLPDVPGAPIRIVVPCCLQMGWSKSPAYFCAVTETTGDIVQVVLADGGGGTAPAPAGRVHEAITPSKEAKDGGNNVARDICLCG